MDETEDNNNISGTDPSLSGEGESPLTEQEVVEGSTEDRRTKSPERRQQPGMPPDGIERRQWADRRRERALEGRERYLDMVQREPVTIQKQGRDVAVMLSPDDFARITQDNVEEFLVFCDEIGRRAETEGLTEEELAEILSEND